MGPGLRGNLAADFGVLIRAGRFAEAEVFCRRRLEETPDDPAALNDLGNVVEELGRLDEAETAYRRAIVVKPDFVEAHYNLGLLLQTRRDLDGAEAAYRQAVVLRPKLVQAHNNLGAVLREQGRPGEAIEAFATAIRLRPDYADAQFNQSMCRLMVGDYARGWPQYEWRWRTRQADVAQRSFRQPLWLGQGSIEGRTILLHAEQGFGDTLQFCRYVPLVAAKGARVVLEVQPALRRLLRRLEGVSEVVGQGEPLGPFDCHTPLMSLPAALGTQLETVPACTPYLSPDPQMAADWAIALAVREGLKVGLTWAGAPRSDNLIATRVDQRRSLPLEALRPLAYVPGVSFCSLQKGLPARQLDSIDWPGEPIADTAALLGDFADTAALVAGLDLVITCDTAVAHLAGALGKPVWILSRFDGCWRWLQGRDDSPWYPTARLFRQPAPGDWESVVDRAAAALAEAVAG